MIVIDVCLSDIPAESRSKSEKNGKTYAKLVVDNRKEKDQYDNTHTVYVNQTKEERASQAKKVYVGNGKEYIFDKQKTTQNKSQAKSQEEDDLPF
jgi:YHS domain-containing protein